MCDYKNGKIYKIGCNITGETYIGSTTKSLEERYNHHKKPSNDCSSKQITERGNFYIELLETYPCNNEFELNRKEGEYQKSIKCINERIAGRTPKEYYEDNKEKIDAHKYQYRQENLERRRNYSIQFYKDNKEKIKNNKSFKITCECGVVFNRQSLSKHIRTKKHKDLMEKLNS